MIKKIVLAFILTFSISAVTFSQESDYIQIEKTLHYYLDGNLIDDFEIIKKAFHANATMKSVSSKTGDYREYNALEVFKNAKKRETPKPNITSRVSYINIFGSAASAKLETNLPRATVVDYMHLLKIDGKWQIVSKIYSVKLKEKIK
ncbi:MAG: nuclear transport factor 2 family protein [Flavobacteriaceae bacterium]|nr:nuclear transport factor 2 family protein [Flavobacteriaceae bacterium]